VSEFSVEIDFKQKDFAFTDEQWAAIIASLPNIAVKPETRHWLGQIAWTHEFHRGLPSGVPLSRMRKRLQRIAKAAAELREAIRSREERFRVAWVDSEIAGWLAERMEERGSTRLAEPSSSTQTQKRGGVV
jgi:hypothetical protein